MFLLLLFFLFSFKHIYFVLSFLTFLRSTENEHVLSLSLFELISLNKPCLIFGDPHIYNSFHDCFYISLCPIKHTSVSTPCCCALLDSDLPHDRGSKYLKWSCVNFDLIFSPDNIVAINICSTTLSVVVLKGR